MKNKLATTVLVQTALFTAIIAILSQIAFPLPSGVPVTLQTFAIALSGFVLGKKFAPASTAIYILIGAVGVPVFAGFSGGLSFVTSYSGGFIWGFLFMAFFCGLGISLKNKVVSITLGLIGLVICHLLGMIQFSIVTSTSLKASFLAVSLPFISKDVISVVLAYVIALAVRKALKSSNLMVSNV